MKVDREKIMLKLGDTIKKQRKVTGLTQKELADYAGCGIAFIYLLESGKTTIRIDKLLDILMVLGLQIRVEMGKDLIAIEGRLK